MQARPQEQPHRARNQHAGPRAPPLAIFVTGQPSLVSQYYDGIDLGRATGRNIASQQTNEAQESSGTGQSDWIVSSNPIKLSGEDLVTARATAKPMTSQD